MFTTIIIIVAVMYFLWKMQPAKGLKSISTNQLRLILHDEDKMFIDVRTPTEYRKRHIPQFRNIPLGSDFSNLPKE